ncbi:MAG TPA: zinc ribbon domain-containing protein [bacterium]|nr:zinc ribbon domain-containing protein [bacterium]
MNIPFTDNYQDLSNDQGYQFKFVCERCGNGYMSNFKKSSTGLLSNALNIAGGLFGGKISTIANTSDDVHRMTAGPAHDKAFEEAIEEIRPKFIQCPRCNNWVCRDHCWNEKKGLCKQDAPDLGVEMAAAQSDRSVEEIHRHAAMAEEDKKLATENWRQNIKASCPKCEAPLATNAKFCPECGEALKARTTCPACNAKIEPGNKFCPECGGKI